MRLLILMSLAGGCAAPPASTSEDTDAPLRDTFVVPTDLTGQDGSIYVGHRADNSGGPGTRWAFAAFVRDDEGIDNLAYCLFTRFSCTIGLPAPNSVLVPQVGLLGLLGPTSFRDAGPKVVAMGTDLLRDDRAGYPLYLGTPTTGQDRPGDLSIEGGQLAPFQSDDAFEGVDEMVTLSPPADQDIVTGPGQQVTLTWVPAEEGLTFLDVVGTQGTARDRIYGLDDARGTTRIDIDDLGMTGPLDPALFVLARERRTLVDAGGNDVKVVTRSHLSWRVVYEDARGWSALDASTGLADDCATAAAGSPLPPGRYLGGLRSGTDAHSLAASNAISGATTPAVDGAVSVSLEAGRQLTATFRRVFGDAVPYLLDTRCDVTMPVAGVNATSREEAEVLTFTAPETGSWVLVLDGAGEPASPTGSFTLELQVQ